jgi:hypothetical protein
LTDSGIRTLWNEADGPKIESEALH